MTTEDATGPSRSPWDQLRVILVVGALLCACFSFIGRYYSVAPPKGAGEENQKSLTSGAATSHVGPSQPDSLLYQMYARAITEGHPYRFMAEDPRSTGSTSHLYPFLLAALYGLGARWHAFATASFVLNSLLFLVFLAIFHKVARRLTPDTSTLATWLLLAGGYIPYTFLGRSESGLFIVIAWGAFAAALSGRAAVCGALLFLAAFTRPEGLILGFFLMLAAAVPLGDDRRRAPRLVAAGLVGFAAGFAAMGLNRILTGHFQFTSVIGKGLLIQNSFSDAIDIACRAFSRIISGVAFGISDKMRQFYALPVAAGLIGMAGLLLRSWRRVATARLEAWWLATALAVAGLVAQSGWAGVQNDRYLAWLFPFFLIYIPAGLREIARVSGRPSAYAAGAVMLLLYNLACLTFYASLFAGTTRYVSSAVDFTVRNAHHLTPRVGTSGQSGLAYYLPDHYVVNANGFVSPAFMAPESGDANADLLKHRPDLRFGSWLIHPGEKSGMWHSPFVGEQLAVSSAAYGSMLGIFRADWTLLPDPDTPLSTETLRAVQGLEAVGRLDVGYRADEKDHDYNVYCRLVGLRLLPRIKIDRQGGRLIADTGRFIYGYERFRIPCRAGLPIRIVMRTASTSSSEEPYTPQGASAQQHRFTSPLTLLVAAGRDASPRPIQIEFDDESSRFREIVFDIPADQVRSDELQVTVGGDHLSYGYWFYQPPAPPRP